MKTIFNENGKPFFALGGQSLNGTAYHDEDLEKFWKALDALHCNLAEIPIYWEAIEPSEGTFDFTMIDKLILQTREHNKKLVILWFGSYKNGNMKNTPSWVKNDTDRFQRVISHSGVKLFVLSSHCEENLRCDKKAFRAVMEHIKEVDKKQHTVMAVQVENEAGIGGRSYRDFSAQAEREYLEDVPESLIRYFSARPDGLVCKAWAAHGSKPKGSWEKLFGRKLGSEYFTAWSVSHYVDEIAAEGKKAYDLPMYANVAMNMQPLGWDLPGTSYTGGGPYPKVYDIWKYNTPHLEILAPDIYHTSSNDFNFICNTYSSHDNILFIPESENGYEKSNFKNMFYALGKYNAVGYAIFGIEDMIFDNGEIRPEYLALADSFLAVSAALPLLCQYNSTGRIHEIVQEELEYGKLMEFSKHIAKIEYDINPTEMKRYSKERETRRARGLIIEGKDDNEFYLLGDNFTAYFADKNDIFYSENIVSNHAAFLSVEEGFFDDSGNFVTTKVRTGDDSDHGVWVFAFNGVVRVRLCQ